MTSNSVAAVVLLACIAREGISGVVHQHRGELRTCYEGELPGHPELQGHLVMRWSFAARGIVTRVAAVKVDPGMEPVARCVGRSIRRWRFPRPPGGGTVQVTYPFVFVATAPEPRNTSSAPR